MSELTPIALPIEAALRGKLIRRYKRFLADIRLEDGSELTVHCPNPGSMRGTQAPGSAIRCSTHESPKRKLRHTLEMIRVGRNWVGLHAVKANAITRVALEADAYAPFSGYEKIESEVSVAEGSRFDFRLSEHENISHLHRATDITSDNLVLVATVKDLDSHLTPSL